MIEVKGKVPHFGFSFYRELSKRDDLTPEDLKGEGSVVLSFILLTAVQEFDPECMLAVLKAAFNTNTEISEADLEAYLEAADWEVLADFLDRNFSEGNFTKKPYSKAKEVVEQEIEKIKKALGKELEALKEKTPSKTKTTKK